MNVAACCLLYPNAAVALAAAAAVHFAQRVSSLSVPRCSLAPTAQPGW